MLRALYLIGSSVVIYSVALVNGLYLTPYIGVAQLCSSTPL